MTCQQCKEPIIDEYPTYTPISATSVEIRLYCSKACADTASTIKTQQFIKVMLLDLVERVGVLEGAAT